MATYRYNVVIDVSVNTAGAKGGTGGAFTDLENQAKRAGSTVTQQMNAVSAATDDSAKKLGIWGQAFRGAFVGAVAGMAFSTIISGITGIVSGIKDMVAGSVQMAASFEMSRNAMTLFAGSAEAGRAELADLDALARNTPGLRMEDAEQGAVRLRALGFEANIVKDLMVGLAKQKLISGVTDEAAMSRVIVNLQQLRAGSPQAMRDIRQMVLALPSLSKEIDKAFGSIEKFRDAIKDDPKNALDKFAKALADAKAPAGGLMDAIGKLEDSVISAGRAFGEPLLAPLTNGTKDLTAFLYDNEAIWRSWGQTVADSLQQVMDAWNAFSNLTGIGTPDAEAGPVRKALRAGGWGIVGAATNYLTLGASGGIETFAGYERIQRLQRESEAMEESLLNAPAKEAKLRSQLGYGEDFIGPVSESMLKPQAQRLKEETEEHRKETLAINERYRQLDINSIRREYADREAELRLHHRYTTQDEIKYQSDLSKIKIESLNKQAEREKQAWEVSKANAGDNGKERAAIDAKYLNFLDDIESQKYQVLVEAEVQRDQLRDKEAEERRRDLTEWAELELRASRQILDARSFNAERQIRLTGAGYEELLKIAEETYKATTAMISKQLELQLEDQRLTEQQRKNLIEQSNLDIQQAAEDHRRAMIEIEDRQYQERIETIEKFSQQTEQMFENIGSRFSTIRGQLSGAGLTRSVVDAIADGLFGGDIDAQIAVFQKDIDKVSGLMQEIEKRIPGLSPQTMNPLTFGSKDVNDVNTYNTYAQTIEQDKQDIDALNAKYGESEKAIYRAAKAYNEGRSSIEAYQQAILNLFDSETHVQIENFRMRLQSANEKRIEAQHAGDIKKASDYESEYNSILSQQTAFIISNTAARKQFYDTTKAGQQETISKLAGGDPETLRNLREGFDAAGRQDVINQYTEIYRLQWQIANGPYLKALTIEADRLKDIVRLQAAHVAISQKLVYSRERADAQVTEFLAQQKGITDIISDTKINMLTTAYSGLDAIANRLTKSFGAFRDVVKDLVANLLKLALNWATGKTGLFGGGQNRGGGINLPGLGNVSMGGGGNGLFNTGSLFGGSAGNGVYNLGGGSGGGLPSAESVLGSLNPNGGGLLGAGQAQQGSLGGLLSGGGGLSGVLGGIAPMLPILGAGVGASIFNGSTGSSILGGIGGGLAGFGVAGLLAPGALSGAIGASVLTTAALSVFALAAAPALLLGAYFVSRNARRRKEETIRNQAMVDAFEQIDKLISDVNSDRIDGASALAQADSIRANYVTEMSKLKDKKTRQHALADVSRIDAKISTLKSAVEAQVTRRERLELMVPTFASGGYMGAVRNPVGFQPGGEQMGYFDSTRTFARFNEQGPEYIFDAETTRNIGVSTLDSIRLSKGQSLGNMRGRTPVINRAGGGIAMPMISESNISGSSASGGPMKLEISLNVGLAAEDFANVVSAQISNNNGSKEQLDAIITTLKNEGYSELAAELTRQMNSGFGRKI